MKKKEENRNAAVIWAAVIIVVGALLGLLIYKGYFEGAAITTQGSSEMKVSPEFVAIYLNAQSTDDSAEDAKNSVSIIVNDATVALLKLGINQEDMETEQFSIYPQYNWTSGRQEIIGYMATQNIKVSVEDIQNAGKYIDAAVDNGALVNYINFELSKAKENEFKAQVLADATKDARAKADSIAAGLGKKVYGVVSVTTNDYNYFPYPLYRAESGSSAKAAVTDITPQKVDITSQVSVTFRIR